MPYGQARNRLFSESDSDLKFRCSDFLVLEFDCQTGVWLHGGFRGHNELHRDRATQPGQNGFRYSINGVEGMLNT